MLLFLFYYILVGCWVQAVSLIIEARWIGWCYCICMSEVNYFLSPKARAENCLCYSTWFTSYYGVTWSSKNSCMSFSSLSSKLLNSIIPCWIWDSWMSDWPCIPQYQYQYQVICSVLQLLNLIIKDNTDFQENACLVGLVSTIYLFIYLYTYINIYFYGECFVFLFLLGGGV